MRNQAADVLNKPHPPKDYDCCGGGCADCELTLYLRKLAEWQRQQAVGTVAVAQSAADRS